MSWDGMSITTGGFPAQTGFAGDALTLTSEGHIIPELEVVVPDDVDLPVTVKRPITSGDVAAHDMGFYINWEKIRVKVKYKGKEYISILDAKDIKDVTASVISVKMTAVDSPPEVSITYKGKTWKA